MKGIALQALPSTIATPEEFFLHSCEVALLYKTPIINEVFEAHRWTKLGQNLSDLYPNGIPIIIAKALLALDSGLQLAEYEQIKNKERQDQNNGNPGG